MPNGLLRFIKGKQRKTDKFTTEEVDSVLFDLNYTGLESFKKMASEYFSDCPSLVSKIQSKRYGKKDLEFIVKFYNDNCAK